MFLVILILASIGLLCGILIYIVNRMLPSEAEILKKTEEISDKLPGINCGACGYPGCFAYAQALARDSNTIYQNPCTTVLQNKEMLENLEKSLNVKLDASSMNKRAVVCCTGDPEIIGSYSGISTCKGASMLSKGFKRCPFGCLGLGDCVEVCPQDAISIDESNGVAVIDPNKCTGCGLCVKECPKGIIKLVPANSKVVFLCNYTSLRDIPGRERCYRGCLHCRKCYKACEQGAIIWNKEKNIPEFDPAKCTLCGACIEACPHDKLIEFYEIIPKIKAGIK